MPPPYQTNCENYNKFGCKSRSDCINKCNIETLLKRCNGLSLSTNVDRHNDKDIYNTSECSMKYNGSECEDKFDSSDCINEYFPFKPFSVSPLNESWTSKYLIENYLMNKTKGQFNLKAFTSVIIRFGDDPDTIYTHSPQLYFVEFLCFVGGVFALWTGFSVMSIYVHGKQFFGGQNKNSNRKAKIFIKRNAIYNIKK